MPNVFFDNRFLDGKAHKEYVAFVDIMGTRTHMKAGVDEAANFIFKLHAAIISAWREKNYGGVFVYPVMDGAYIATKSKLDMINGTPQSMQMQVSFCPSAIRVVL